MYDEHMRVNNTNLCFIWNVVPTSRNQSPRATIWSKYWRLTSIAGAFRLRDDNGPHCFFFTQENLPNPVRHVRLLLLYPILRDRGSPLHRILNSPFHVVTFLSIIHVICRKRRQILDGENFSKFTKFMILGFKIHQLLTSLIKEVPTSEQGRRKEKPLEDI